MSLMMPRNHYGQFPFAPPHENTEKVAAASPSAIGSSLHSARISEVEATALRAMKEGIFNVPHDEKSSLVHVQRVQPDLVDDDHLLGFLRAEDFNVDLALNRIVRYWEHRRKVFGPDKFARPMTLNGAMEGRIDALKQGFLYLLPVLDEAGRAIIYSSYSSQDPHLNMRAEDKIQVWWYLLHVAMEMPGVAEKGFVILSNGENFRLNNFDGKWNVAACCSGDRDFPIRWKMAHICHSNAVFPFLASAVKAVLSPKQRESFILHNGSTATVLGSLSEYSLPKHCVPEDLGGSLHVSIDDFVRERLVIEGGASDLDINNEGNSSISQAGHSILVHEMQKGANGVETGSFIGSRGLHCDIPGDNQSDGTRSELTPMEAEPTNANPIINPKTMGKMPFAPPVLENGRNTSFAPEVPAQEEPKKGRSNLGNIRQTSQAGTSKSHPGRTGDPRMNGAVQAKLDNPNLPLVAALFAGGFVFPDIDTPGVKLKDVKDTDNVTVNQRKNQLLRRLRVRNAKEKVANLDIHRKYRPNVN